MAVPTQFPGANFLWRGRPETDTTEEILDLPAYRAPGMSISCWRLTADEIDVVKRTGLVYVLVQADFMPPIYISGTDLLEDAIDG